MPERHLSDNELFRRFRHFCKARVAFPVCKQTPPELENLIVELWHANIQQLDALEAELNNKVHSDDYPEKTNS